MRPVRALFWASGATTAWVLVGYPAVLALLPRRPWEQGEELPRVSVIIAAYRERDELVAKLRSLDQQGYPADRLQVIVVVDEDRETADLARDAHPDALVLFAAERGGKPAALNRGIAAADGDVVIMTDANNLLEPGSLRAALRHFADPSIVAVAGRRGEDLSAYDRYESLIRTLETRSGSVAAMSGELMAVRRDHLDFAFPEDAVSDDLWLLCAVARRGGRVVYEPEAGSTEPLIGTRAEVSRRSRMSGRPHADGPRAAGPAVGLSLARPVAQVRAPDAALPAPRPAGLVARPVAPPALPGRRGRPGGGLERRPGVNRQDHKTPRAGRDDRARVRPIPPRQLLRRGGRDPRDSRGPGHPLGPRALGGALADASLGTKTLRSAFWAYGSYVGGRLLGLATIAILARVLVPEDFGLVALALTFTTLLETLKDFGLSQALIVSKDEDLETKSNTVFFYGLAVALSTALVIVAIAPLVARFFDEPDLLPLILVLSLNFPLRALGVTHEALAMKRLNFRARTAAEICEVTMRGIVGVILALLGFGAWSLVLGLLAGAVVWAAVLWRLVPWRPRLRARRSHVRELFTFGGTLTGVNVLHGLTASADSMIIGRVLGPTSLGLYSLGFRLPQLAVVNISMTTGIVLFPAYTKVGESGCGARICRPSASPWSSRPRSPRA